MLGINDRYLILDFHKYTLERSIRESLHPRILIKQTLNSEKVHFLGAKIHIRFLHTIKHNDLKYRDIFVLFVLF